MLQRQPSLQLMAMAIIHAVDGTAPVAAVIVAVVHVLVGAFVVGGVAVTVTVVTVTVPVATGRHSRRCSLGNWNCRWCDHCGSGVGFNWLLA